jgi:four helix bundle protein
MNIHDLDALENRTRLFVIRVIKFAAPLESSPGLRYVVQQLIDAAGSVGSNHRAMRRARSQREFMAKLCIVVEESDESVFWLEVIEGVRPSTPDLPGVLSEGRALRAIFAKARSTTRSRTAIRD